MKNHVKSFGDYLNESKFYHAIPQGELKLRDQFKELSDREKEEFSDLAKELDELNVLARFKKGMSKYKSLSVLKRAMRSAIKAAKAERVNESARKPHW